MKDSFQKLSVGPMGLNYSSTNSLMNHSCRLNEFIASRKCKLIYTRSCFLLFIVLFASCAGAGFSWKMNYTQNKMVFLAAMIDEYIKTYKHYPVDISPIQASAGSYIANHPSFKKTYFKKPPAFFSVDLMETGTGNPIHYLYDKVNDRYFLYCSYGKTAEKPLEASELSSYLQGLRRSSDLYLISNGVAYSGPGIKGEAKNIDINNMSNFMRPL